MPKIRMTVMFSWQKDCSTLRMAAREENIAEHVKLQKLRCYIFKSRIGFEFILLYEVKWSCVEMNTHPSTVQRSTAPEFYLRTTVRHRGIMGSQKRKVTLVLFKRALTASFSYFKLIQLNRSAVYGTNGTTFPKWRRLATSCVDWQILYKQVIMISR